jgi:1-acyl-sn-glycerol-3-phosphate acyltransferase
MAARCPEVDETMQFLRSKIFDVLWMIWTVAFLPSIPILMLHPHPTRSLRFLARVWVKGMFLMLKHIVGLNYMVRGRENIPPAPCIVISNHQSTWETLAFILEFPDIAVITKRELLRVPIFGWYLKKYPMILIDRAAGIEAIQQMVDGTRKALSEGRSVLLFPEGTRKSVSDRITIRRGILALYSQLNTMVLPVAVNSGVFWGPDRMFKYSGTITMSYLPPIPPGLSQDEFNRIAQEVLQQEKDRLVRELDVDIWLEALG